MHAERSWREKAVDHITTVVMTLTWATIVAAVVTLIVVPGVLQIME